MSTGARSPAQLRNMFGANLRKLSESYASVSALARDLGINRTQFNRYLSGESFPRPDVLSKICEFFKVDARVLLEPVEQIARGDGPVTHPFLQEFMGSAPQLVAETEFPNGFYHFSRRSFMRNTEFVRGLVHVHRDGQSTFVRGYEPKMAMAIQGIPPLPPSREFRGFVMKMDDGVSLTMTRRNGLTASFNFLSRVSSFENNYWVGYVARTVPENSSSTRITRMVYEHIPNNFNRVLQLARASGFCAFESLIPFHQRLLQPSDAFR
ncbi:MAG: helix-turn-helix transcriptional regulator [Pseudomonadota bacterium]